MTFAKLVEVPIYVLAEAEARSSGDVSNGVMDRRQMFRKRTTPASFDGRRNTPELVIRGYIRPRGDALAL